MIELRIVSHKHTESIPLQDQIETLLAREGWREGILTLFVPHTTAAITVQEDYDPNVMEDLFALLERLAPWEDPTYRHREGNAASHLKAALVGNSLQLLVENSKLRLGRWQGVFFCEFDGPRTRSLWAEFVPKSPSLSPAGSLK